VLSQAESTVAEPPPAAGARAAAGFDDVAAGGSAIAAGALRTLAGAWPPPGAQAVPVDRLYDRLGELGFDYGPVFQGVRAAWRRGEELFAEVTLPEELTSEAGAFGVHPALLDAAFHVALALPGGEESAEVRLPFAWSEVRLFADGAHALRVALSHRDAGAISLAVADESGAPVAVVDSAVARAISAEQLGAARGREQRNLFGLQWPAIAVPSEPPVSQRTAVLGEERGLAESLRAAGIELSTCAELDALEDGIELVLVDCAAEPGGASEGAAVAAATRTVLREALAVLQEWLSDRRLDAHRLVFLTRGAVATSPGEDVQDLAGAAAWGLVRSAQAEHPDRFALIDVDGDEDSWRAVAGALACGEAQLAIRAGAVHVPRLARAASAAGARRPEGGDAGPRSREGELAHGPLFGGEGTILVTGGTGGLGALLAGHLVERHGVRRLLLVSRRGEQAPDAGELRARLVELGAQVRIAACDVADREQLEELLDSIPAEQPLRGVVHTAGTIDDGTIGSLREEQLESVLAAKVDGALHLHELTERLGLDAFVLFSSVAGVLGSAGQGNYAAANAFLDALAIHRRARGLPASSIAWGLWAGADRIEDAAHRTAGGRMAGSGVRAFSGPEGLLLFDAACELDEALAVPLSLDVAALRAHARAGTVAPLLRGLIRAPARRADGESFVRRLAGMPAAERGDAAGELVRAEVAAVLGHSSPRTIDRRSAFKELGFDSLTAVELRNRLGAATGLRLPATLIFDHPTIDAVAAHLASEACPDHHGIGELDPEEAELRGALASIPLARLREAGLIDTLIQLARGDEPPVEQAGAERIDELDVEELVRMTFEQAGSPGPNGVPEEAPER
jgi:acyl carrier protein